MSKALPVFLILNIAAAVGIYIFLPSGEDGNSTSQSISAYTIKVSEKSAQDQLEAGLMVASSKKKGSDRKQRLSARFFLPAMGERNAFTDAVDGMVIENIKRRSPVVRSFEKLLKEEDPEISKEELNEKKKKFNLIISDYLRKVYKIQRGLEQEGTVEEHQMAMQAQLGQELQLAGARLNRLKDIESSDKAARQIKVYERLLIRDKDKLNEEQESSIKEILRNQQTTIFDPLPTVDEAYNKSEGVLKQVEGLLNADQTAHFKYFQEYHWHSYDMQELNDMPTFGR